jgi:nicotinamide-nucleotide amidase
VAEALSPILPDHVERLAHRALREACAGGLTLATAESCTGGLVASLLTDVPGCSHAFERGFVAYTDQAKIELLGVSPRTLKQYGPVSEPTAKEMAAGALSRSPADVALAVTGWMEQGAGADQPAGLIWFASVRRGVEPVTHRAEFGPRGRAALRIACLDKGLSLMLDRIAGR